MTTFTSCTETCEFKYYTCHNENTICVEGNGKLPHRAHILSKKQRVLSLVSATLEIEYLTQRSWAD